MITLARVLCAFVWLPLTFGATQAIGEEWGWARVEMVGFALESGRSNSGPFVTLTHTRPGETSFPFTSVIFDLDTRGDDPRVLSILETALTDGLEVHILSNFDEVSPPTLPTIKRVYLTNSPAP